MRVSTQMIFSSGVSTMQQRTAETLRLQQQISSNRRILTPSDDPVAAAQALEVTQAKTLNELFIKNQASAGDALALQEGQIAAAEDLLQTVHEKLVQLANATLSDNDRRSITTELRQRFDELKGIANQQDGTGNYLFSGFRGDTEPFTGNVDTGVSYNGDNGQRLLRVSASRDMEISDSGQNVFMSPVNDSIPFAVGNSSLNTGSGEISEATIIDGSKWSNILNPKNFTIHFAVAAGVTTYDIVNDEGISLLTNAAAQSASPPVTPPLPGTYVSGEAIELKALPATVGGMDFGASFKISGSPGNGDTFSIRPTAPVSVFDTLSSLILAAEVSLEGSTAAKRAEFAEKMDTGIANILSAQENMLKTRATIGARMNELDSLADSSSQRSLDYAATLSRLQDVDMTAAISELNQTQLTLEAAQMSFSKISQLSLFNYI